MTAPEAPPARPTWKLWHLPLMLLPSVLYLVLYPVIYRNAVEDALHTFILEHRPYLKWGNTRMMCALGATLKCAFLMLLVLLPVSFLWARSKHGKSIADGGRLLGGCLLVIIVNGAICYGGCSLGDYRTRDRWRATRQRSAPTGVATTARRAAPS